MNFAFLQIGDGLDKHLALLMIKSIRRTHREPVIYQITKSGTPTVPGVGHRVSSDKPISLFTYFLEGLLALPDAPTVVLDTDMIVQRNLEHVFDEPFDLAVTDRHTHVEIGGKSIEDTMPFQAGIFFSRSRMALRQLHDKRMEHLDEHDWFTKERAIKRAVDEAKIDVKILRGNDYNYSPSSIEENVYDKYVVHYKGPTRKKWMMIKYRDQLPFEIKVKKNAPNYDRLRSPSAGIV